MLRLTPLLLLIALAACGTPEERCLRRAQPDTAALDEQIAQTRLNLARGYRREKGTTVNLGLALCSSSGNVDLCLGGNRAIPPKLVPIDRAQETALLKELEARRAEEIARSERAQAACRAMP